MAVSVGSESDTIAEVDADCQFVACSQTSQQIVSVILMAPIHTLKWHCVKPPTPNKQQDILLNRSAVMCHQCPLLGDGHDFILS